MSVSTIQAIRNVLAQDGFVYFLDNRQMNDSARPIEEAVIYPQGSEPRDPSFYSRLDNACYHGHFHLSVVDSFTDDRDFPVLTVVVSGDIDRFRRFIEKELELHSIE